MSSPIAPLTTTPVAAGVGASAASADPRRAAKLQFAAKEFESILVKQLLSAAKVGGPNPTGYADMAVDALATGVEKAGGLGLARRIEETLSHSLSKARLDHDGAAPASAPTPQAATSTRETGGR